MGLAITDYTAATGALREIYDRMRERSLPPIYRPPHGGVPGIVTAHSLDPALIPKVFAAATTLDSAGPLTWPERELVSAVTSRLGQCFYCMASHTEFMRVAQGDEAAARGVLEDPQEIAARWPDARLRMLAELALVVTETPWTLSRKHLARAHQAGLSDEDVLHVVTLSSYIGHQCRIAAATGVPLDYEVKLEPPPIDRAKAPWPVAPSLLAGRPAIDIARRPATANAFTEWKHYIFYSHDAPLTRRQRTLVARWVATWLGDGGISPPTDLTFNPLDDALRTLAEVVTLQPWQITDDTFAPLRRAGFDDRGVFDVCATASSAGVFSRIEVALAALSA